MREFAKVSPQFWIGETGKQIKSLGIETQLIALYLLTCPHANMIGVYYLPVTFISHETGIPSEGALKALHSLSEVSFCTYNKATEYVWVHEMAYYQAGGQLKQNDNRVKGINDVFENLPNLPFLQHFFEKYNTLFWLENPPKNISSLEGPSETLLSKEKDKEKKISMSGNPDVDSLFDDDFSFEEQKHSPKIQRQAELKSQALEVIEFLNQKTGRVYRPVDTNLKLIMARLKSGATVMDCRQVIAKKTREWKGDAKMAEYLRPATLFNATKFEQYVGELVIPDEE
jgi:uncharacterized phage protein (TIGR02220 family)